MHATDGSPELALDARLAASSPATPLAATLDDAALLALADAARTEARRDRRRSRRSKVAVVSAMTALLLGGSGVAVAANSFEWPGWAVQPELRMEVESPSGEICEYRVGNLENGSEAATAATAAFFEDAPAPTFAEIDADVVAVHGVALEGLPQDRRDLQFKLAVIGVVQTRLDASLQAQGLDVTERPQFEAIVSCPDETQ